MCRRGMNHVGVTGANKPPPPPPPTGSVSVSSPRCVSITRLTFVTLAASLFAVRRAADWKLDSPDWTGRMRLTARGKVAYVKLEDKISGERRTDGRADGQSRVIVYWAVVNHVTV